MVILDTRENPEYRGNIHHAIDLFKSGECDRIITQSTDFICISYKDDEHLRELARRYTNRELNNSQVRYIITSDDNKGNFKCLCGDYAFRTTFSRAIFYKTRESAESSLRTVIRKAGNKQGEADITYRIETYLYRSSACCHLRIYYNMVGLATDYGILNFIRENVKNGILYPRHDHCGKEFILLDDLLFYKDEVITFKSSDGVLFKRPIDLRLVLHDGLIAFDSISNFVVKHPDLEIPEVKYLTSRQDDNKNQRVFYDLGAVVYSSSLVQDCAEKEFGLSSWFDK